MEPNRDLLSQTAQIVSSHLSHNEVKPDQIPDLIREVYSALTNLGGQDTPEETLNPAVPIKRSVFPDHIVCLEDGKQLKMLKRHLMTSYQMTPDDYRKRWNLPYDYPMVAPNYAQTRSSLAKKIGLGQRRFVVEEDNEDVSLIPTPSRSTNGVVAHSEQQPANSVRRFPEGVSSKRKVGRPRKNAA